MDAQDAVNDDGVPCSGKSWLQPFALKHIGNALVRFPSRPQRFHTVDDGGFTRLCAERKPSFAAPRLGLFTLTCTPKFGDNGLPFILAEGSQNLPHQFPARVIGAQVWLCNRPNLETTALEVSDDRFLHHEVSRKAVEFFHQYQPDAV